MQLCCSRRHPNSTFGFEVLGPDYSGTNQFEFTFVCSECGELVSHVITGSELNRLSNIAGNARRVQAVRSTFGPTIAQANSPTSIKFTTQDHRFLKALKIADEDEVPQ